MTVTITDAAKSQKATVEEVEDEDEAPRTSKKKKKKKKPKKKKPAASELQQGVPAVKTTQAPAAPDPVVRPQSPLVTTSKKTAAPPTSPSSKAGPAKPVPSMTSTASIPLGRIESTTAQSARSYLQSENLDAQRTKIKSRPDYATSFTEKPEKKGVFSKLMGRNKDQEETKGAKHSWFSRLTKKTTGYMHQLLNSPESDTKGITPMKWEHFLKVSLVECYAKLMIYGSTRSCERWDLNTILALQARASVLTLVIRVTRFVK